jgi:hypothetical protein
MSAITKTISTTQARVDFLDLNNISPSFLFNEACDNLKSQMNNVLVQTLRAKNESLDKFYNQKLIDLKKENFLLKQELEKTEKMFEEVKGGLNVKN